jgi:enoyl-CoA hydratase/carnithine racemase
VTEPTDTAGYRAIRYEVDGGVATITLERPDRLNAFTTRMALELLDALDRVDADPDVRALVVTGAGRAFCAGADLSGGSESFDPASLPGAAGSGGAGRRGSTVRRELDPRRDVGGVLTLRLFDLTKPVIAAVNGPAVGVGATMTLPMDLRLASTSARYGFVFAARGIVPEACSSWFLPRLVGIQQALEWCYTARVVGADEVLAAGLVRSLHEPEDLVPAAQELARSIAEHAAPVSVALTRQMMWKGLTAAHPMEAHRVDSPGVEHTGGGADAREGISAFFEKRSPAWGLHVPDDLPDWFPWWEQPDFDA